MSYIGPDRRRAFALNLPDLPPAEGEIRHRIEAAHAALLGAMKPLRRLFRPQDVIIASDERPSAIYTVQSGLLAERRMLTDGRAHIRGFLLPGDCFGALSSAPEHQTSHSVEALAPSTVTVLDQPQLTRLKADHRDIELALMWLFAQAQSRHRDWETILACGNAFEKIAAMLFDLCERTRAWQHLQDVPVRLPIGQREIAEHLGLTLPHVSRILRLFRDSGLIASHYRAIEVRNPAALAQSVKLIRNSGQSD